MTKGDGMTSKREANDKSDFTLTPKQEEAFDVLMKNGGDAEWVPAEEIGLMFALEALEKVGVVQITEHDGNIFVAQAGILMGPPGAEDELEEVEEPEEDEAADEGEQEFPDKIAMMPSDWRELFASVKGIGSAKIDAILDVLKEQSIETLEGLTEMDMDDLPGVGPSTEGLVRDKVLEWSRRAKESPDKVAVRDKLKKLRMMQRRKKLEDGKE
jgi:hypothetical protein